MKEHKNPKVLSEGILWMVSAVEDFGVLHLKLKVIYPMCCSFSSFILSCIYCVVLTMPFFLWLKFLLTNIFPNCRS